MRWRKWRESAGKSQFLGIFIIRSSGITLWAHPASRGSGVCFRGGEGAVPSLASSHGPEQGTVLHLHVQRLQLHYWITLTGRPLVSYFITWVKKKQKKARRVKIHIFHLASHPQKQPWNMYTTHVRKPSVRLEYLKFGVKGDFYWGSGNRSQKAQGKYHSNLCTNTPRSRTCLLFNINISISVGGYTNAVVYTCVYTSKVQCFIVLYVHQCHLGKHQEMSFTATLPAHRARFP